MSRHQARCAQRYGVLVGLLVLSACTADQPSGNVGNHQAALTAYCEVQLGKDPGVSKDMETDYVPHVLSCENHAAPLEALKALAVVARSMAYYKMDHYGWTQDGTSAQVYTCPLKLEQQHIDASLATAGQVLRYNGKNLWGCHVAGAKPSDPQTCVAKAGDPDSSPPSEWAVTYNWGKTGADVEQSGLGLIDPTNDYNRGCFSQNGSSCLAQQPKGYKDILRFYFGADIEIATASGPCVPPAPDGGAPPPGDGAPPHDGDGRATDLGSFASVEASAGLDGGGVVAQSDGGSPASGDAAPAAASSADGGCAAVRGTQPAWGSLLVLLLLLLALAARRRRCP